jgi:hypothetical protein
LILFNTRTNSQPRIGRISDAQCFNKIGLRYKIERRMTGMFLEDIAGYINNQSKYIKTTKWCFFMWMKPERIIRTINL